MQGSFAAAAAGTLPVGRRLLENRRMMQDDFEELDYVMSMGSDDSTTSPNPGVLILTRNFSSFRRDGMTMLKDYKKALKANIHEGMTLLRDYKNMVKGNVREGMTMLKEYQNMVMGDASWDSSDFTPEEVSELTALVLIKCMHAESFELPHPFNERGNTPCVPSYPSSLAQRYSCSTSLHILLFQHLGSSF